MPNPDGSETAEEYLARILAGGEPPPVKNDTTPPVVHPIQQPVVSKAGGSDPNFTANNARNELANQLATGRYITWEDIQGRGWLRNGEASFINPNTREVWNRDPTSGAWSTSGYRANAAEVAALRLQQGANSSAPPSPTPGVAPASPPTPGAGPNSVALNAIAGRGGLFTNEQSLADARALGGNYLPGTKVDLGNAMRPFQPTIAGVQRDADMVRNLPYYQNNVAGGPGRAGYGPFANQILRDPNAPYGGWTAALRGMADLPAGFKDFSLMLPQGYNPEDPYGATAQQPGGGMPSVHTTYNGAPASLSIGTAGAEIRGGTAGGWGGDAGAILAAHGLAPSNDPMVNAAMAAAIASGQGQFSFTAPGMGGATGPGGGGDTNYGGGNAFSSNANGGEVYYKPEQYAAGGTVSFAAGGVTSVYNPSLGNYSNYDASGNFTGYSSGVSGTAASAPPVIIPDSTAPPVVMPTTAGPPVALPPVTYSAADQALSNSLLETDRQHAMYGYRNQMAGLPQTQAIQLGQGEVPSAPAPSGFYYRQFDPLQASRGLANNNYSWGLAQPYDQIKQSYYDALNPAPVASSYSGGGSGGSSSYSSSPYQYAGNRSDGSPIWATPPSAPSIGRPAPAWGGWGFAGGGQIYSPGQAAVTQQPNGRKSMITPEPISMIGQQTNTMYGEMGEVAPEAVTMGPNSMKIDPIPGASYQQPQQPESIVPMSEYKWLVSRNPAIAASLAQMEMSGKPTAAMMEMTLGRIEGISDNAIRQRALAAYGGIVNAVNQGRVAPPLVAPGTKVDPVGIAAALKFAGEGTLVA